VATEFRRPHAIQSSSLVVGEHVTLTTDNGPEGAGTASLKAGNEAGWRHGEGTPVLASPTGLALYLSRRSKTRKIRCTWTRSLGRVLNRD